MINWLENIGSCTIIDPCYICPGLPYAYFKDIKTSGVEIYLRINIVSDINFDD